MKKIAIDIRTIGRSRTGSEVVVLHLVKNLLEIDRENQYRLLTDTDDRDVLDYVKKSLNLSDKKNVEIVSLPAANKFSWAAWHVSRWARKNPIDVYHTEYIVPFFMPSHVKMIAHMHDVSFADPATRDLIKKSDLFFLDALIPRSLRAAHMIFAASQFTKGEIMKHYQIDAEKIHVIYNAVGDTYATHGEQTTRTREALRKKYNLPEKYILTLSSLQPRKNIPRLIAAFAKIVPKIPDTDLVIAGKRAHNFDALIDDLIAKDAALDTRIMFTGYIDDADKMSLFAHAHAFVYPSLYEGFGVPVLEALSVGTPTLVSDIPPHHEVGGGAVLYADPQQIDQLSQKLYDVCTDSIMRRTLTHRGVIQAQKFTWRTSAQKVHTLIHRFDTMGQKKQIRGKRQGASGRRKMNKKIFLGGILVIILALGILLAKAGITIQNISTKGGGFFNSVARILPGGDDALKADRDGRTNIALIGIRGENVPGGGLLADTIIVASITSGSVDDAGNTQPPKASLISIPRDLYVDIDGDTDGKGKINAVHFFGEEKGSGQGLVAMQDVLEKVTGQKIHYALSINFKGFEKAIDDVGGVSVTLDEPFTEPLQFHQAHVCDAETFTVPAGTFEKKIDERGKVVAQYPLCYNNDEECGGVFTLPAGVQNLDGAHALCYARARMTSSDFDRARRQQEVLGALQEKVLSTGTFFNIARIAKLLDTLESNVRTDMELWEMEQFAQLYRSLDPDNIKNDVLDTAQDGLLYTPEESNGNGFVLLPVGDNYDRIHELFTNSI